MRFSTQDCNAGLDRTSISVYACNVPAAPSRPRAEITRATSTTLRTPIVIRTAGHVDTPASYRVCVPGSWNVDTPALCETVAPFMSPFTLSEAQLRTSQALMVQYNLGGVAEGASAKRKTSDSEEDPLVGSHAWCVPTPLCTATRQGRLWRLLHPCVQPHAALLP